MLAIQSLATLVDSLPPVGLVGNGLELLGELLSVPLAPSWTHVERLMSPPGQSSAWLGLRVWHNFYDS